MQRPKRWLAAAVAIALLVAAHAQLDPYLEGGWACMLCLTLAVAIPLGAANPGECHSSACCRRAGGGGHQCPWLHLR